MHATLSLMGESGLDVPKTPSDKCLTRCNTSVADSNTCDDQTWINIQPPRTRSVYPPMAGEYWNKTTFGFATGCQCDCELSDYYDGPAPVLYDLPSTPTPAPTPAPNDDLASGTGSGSESNTKKYSAGVVAGAAVGGLALAFLFFCYPFCSQT